MQYKTTKHRRITRVRAKVRGSADCPRLTVFRSNRHLYVQLIDDRQGRTLAAAHDGEVTSKSETTLMTKAGKIGELLAQKALKVKISKVKFDRGPYAYHGQVKAIAEGARLGGLQF